MAFTLYPAIDLRKGQVVRLIEGDPERQTSYGSDPGRIAARWIECGATWLHVVNLDGALDETDSANYQALKAILAEASSKNVLVQFGGGLRNLEAVGLVLSLGVFRAVLGTIAVENPELVQLAVQQFGAEHIAVSLDARDGIIQTHGWKEASRIFAVDLAQKLHLDGLRTLVFTDIARDGKQTGINLSATQELAQKSGLEVIASGGVRSTQDVALACQARLSGIIIGKALYEQKIDLKAAISAYQTAI